MSNLERAAQIVDDLIDETHLFADGELGSAIVQEFHAENLLLPDLPKPTVRTDGTASWFDALDEDMPVWVTVPGETSTHWYDGATIESPDRVSLRACTDYGDEPESLTPDDARRVALALLAAAAWAEKQ